MKNKFFKSIFIITAVFSCCFMFSSFSPSLDGRAIVVEDGVFPQGLFAKTVGYLPGDIISVTNISGEKTVDILVIGALDPSEGVAIMLSPEAAKAIGIEKSNSNIVKITKRSGQDERVYGSAVIARQMNEFVTEPEEKEETPSIPYISYEDDFAADEDFSPSNTVQVSSAAEKNVDDYIAVNPSETNVYAQTTTQPILASAEISAIKGGVSDIDRKSLKDTTSSEPVQQPAKEEEIYSAKNLSKEILDIPNAKSSKVDTVDNINLDEISVDNAKSSTGYNAPQGIPASENVREAADNKEPVYSEPLYQDKKETEKETPLPEEPVLLDDLDSVSPVGPDSYDEQEAIIGAYGISAKSTILDDQTVPPPFDEGAAQKKVYTDDVEQNEMYTANQPKTEIPSQVPFEEEEELYVDNNEAIVPEDKELAENSEPESDKIENDDADNQNSSDKTDNDEINPKEEIAESSLENTDIEADKIEEEPVELSENTEESTEKPVVVENDEPLEEPLLEEKVELDTLEAIEDNKELVKEDEITAEPEESLEAETIEEELPNISEYAMDDTPADSEVEPEAESEDESEGVEEEVVLDEEPSPVNEIAADEKMPEAEDSVLPEDDASDMDKNEGIVLNDVDSEDADNADFEYNDGEFEALDNLDDTELADAEDLDYENETLPVENDLDSDSSLYGSLEEVSEDFEDSLFFVEDELAATEVVEDNEPVYSKELISLAETDEDFVDEKLPAKTSEVDKQKELLIPEEIIEDFDDSDGFKEEEMPVSENESEENVAESVPSIEPVPVIENEEIDADADYEEFNAITLVPAEDNPPVPVENEVEKNETEIVPVPVVEDEVAVEENKLPDSHSSADVKLCSYEKFVVKGESSLVSGKYYIQIATLSKDENILEVVNKYSANYPFVIIPLSNGSKKILVGPLTVDEYATVLERFKSYGYKDAFLKKIK